MAGDFFILTPIPSPKERGVIENNKCFLRFNFLSFASPVRFARVESPDSYREGEENNKLLYI